MIVHTTKFFLGRIWWCFMTLKSLQICTDLYLRMQPHICQVALSRMTLVDLRRLATIGHYGVLPMKNIPEPFTWHLIPFIHQELMWRRNETFLSSEHASE